MNILTFDIEEWCIEQMYHGSREFRYKTFDRLLNKILNFLDERNVKATFFCLGKLTEDFPHVVKSIHDRGHEIGCHSHTHQWLNKLSYEEVLNDTRQAVDGLEQCIGKKVHSYRAPAFSIGESNKWAFEVLSSCGIENDASVFPTSRDFGGFPSFGESVPSRIIYNGIEIKEFPIQTMQIFGKQIVYSGGGYFRLFPLSMIVNQMNKRDYSMTYFHIGDLIQETTNFMSRGEYERYFKENGALINRTKRYLKSNIGTGNAFGKLTKLIDVVEFHSLHQAHQMIHWESAPLIEL